MRCTHLGTGFWFLVTVMACSLVGAQEPAQQPAAPPDEVRPADPDEEAADEETLFGLVLDPTDAPRLLISSVAPGSLAAEAGLEQMVELAVAENPTPRPPRQASDQLIPPDVLTTIGLAVLERPSNTLRVAAVVAHSPAAVAGIQRGDSIRSLAQQPIGTAAELAAVISMHQRGEAVPFEVVRRRETVTGSLTLQAEPAAMVDYVRALQEQVDALSRTVEAMSKEIEALRGESGGRSAAGARPGRREPVR